MSLIVWGSNLTSLPSGAPRVPKPTPWAKRRQSDAEAAQQIRELIAFSVGKSRPDDCSMLGCYEGCRSFNTQRTVSRAISSSSSVGMT
jgi:hypothetical protein